MIALLLALSFFPWHVRVVNDGTAPVRVVDHEKNSNAAIRVWPGQEAVLLLDTPGTRTLWVEVGTQSFATDRFTPSDVQPCWKLEVRRWPYLETRTGPMMERCP